MAFFSRRSRSWLVGLLALAGLIAFCASRVDAQGFPFAFPTAPPGTPAGYIPQTVDTRGNVTYGPPSFDAGALSPGSAGQVLWTPNGATAPIWAATGQRSAVTADAADPTGAADASTAIHNCLVNAAAANQCCWLPPGTYKVASTVTVPSSGCLQTSPGVTINSTITISGSKTNAVFSAVASIGTSTTLASTPTFGSSTLALTSATGFSKGQLIEVSSATYVSLIYYYTVENLSGTTVTTDHPLLMPWTSGDTVAVVTSAPTNITIAGKGTLTGTFDTGIYLQGCQACAVDDLEIIPTSTTSYGLFFDYGGYRNRSRGVRVDASGNGSTSTQYASAFFVDSNHSTTIEKPAANNFAPGGNESAGVVLMDCADSEIRSAEVTGCDIGGLLIAHNDTAPGCYGCRVTGGSFVRNSTGLDIAFGSSYNAVTGADLSYNTINGLLNETGSVSNSVVGSKLVGNGNNGIVSTGDRLTVSSSEIGGNTAYGIEQQTAGSVTVVGSTAKTANGSGAFIFASGTVQANIIGGDYELGAGFGAYVQTCPVIVQGTRFNNGGTVFNLTSSGSLRMSNVMLAGTSTTGVAVASGTTLYVGENNNLTAAGTPLSNSGAVTAAWDSIGATAVSVGGSLASSVPIGNSTNATSVSETVKSGGTVTSVVGSTTVSSQGAASGDFSGYGTSFGTNGHVRCTSSDDCVDSPGTLNIGTTSSTTVDVGGTGSTTALNLEMTSGGNFAVFFGGTVPFEANASAIFPGGFGITAIGGSTLPFGSSFLGASTTSGLGYTEFAAAGGSHNTQNAISYQQVISGRLSSYSAGSFNTYAFVAHHGVSYTCTATARVVTSGSGGTCSFWATGVHGAADQTFACTVRASGAYTGSAFGSYASPYYMVCDVTGSSNPAAGTSPTNPVLTFNATQASNVNTITWALFNDSCSTPPVVDVISKCQIEDD